MTYQLISDGHQPVGTIFWDDEAGLYEASVFFMPFYYRQLPDQDGSDSGSAQAQRLLEHLGRNGASGCTSGLIDLVGELSVILKRRHPEVQIDRETKVTQCFIVAAMLRASVSMPLPGSGVRSASLPSRV